MTNLRYTPERNENTFMQRFAHTVSAASFTKAPD